VVATSTTITAMKVFGRRTIFKEKITKITIIGNKLLGGPWEAWVNLLTKKGDVLS
jgi:hypothetical protein